MNESLFDYLLDYRIEKSLPLLLERQASITSVAEQTGFSSPAYFSKIFRQQMGCSPERIPEPRGSHVTFSAAPRFHFLLPGF